ncbi:CheR family methyltransferase [Sagittula sp. SSi028]|uniref:CheR family methyltransferase n=1 Tax=Sagittula sp. SSi028 TaxID=3400636 RepID=UPI003AF424C5
MTGQKDQTETEGQMAGAAIPLIAVGASAGGLDPLEAFFSSADEANGWCYVVIQHLSPDYRSMMDEILGRKTRLKIRHIDDGVALEPNTIFLNRPNTAVELVGDTFRTRAYNTEDGLPHLPIDGFFSSLTSRPMGRTGAVILSGSGSDGTIGAQRIHAAGGLVLAQTPSEAAFPSMPSTLITTGAADAILPAGQMMAAIENYLMHGRSAVVHNSDMAGDEKRQILQVLENQHQIDFSPYKSDNVERRIARRQHLRGLETLADYAALIQNNTDAVDELYRDLLIGVTYFYRDPEAIAALRARAINPLAESYTGERPLRIWVPGCASGEEAYTIAMEISEAMSQAGHPPDFRILATDVHRHSLDVASAGVFSAEAMQKVPPAKRKRYFQEGPNGFTVTHDLRQRIIFSVHNALSDPPFLDLDLVSCRNMLIYLKDEAQARVLSMFLFGLRRNGILFLGPSESLGRLGDDFVVLDGRWRLFRKNTEDRGLNSKILAPTVARRVQRPFQDVVNTLPGNRHSPAVNDFATQRTRETLIRSYDVLLKHYAPSSILITSDGDVLSWFGTASILVDTMNNMADWTVEGVVHPDLHFVINVGIEKLRSGELDSLSRTVDVDLGNGRYQHCTVTLEVLDQTSKPRLMLLKVRLDDSEREESKADSAPDASSLSPDDADALTRRIYDLERDLKLTEETLQHVTERLEAAGEELQASNEELQASNEELQASNEELQASNEELHAVNEELVSLSAEHEHKIRLLSSIHSETDFLLNVLELGVIFLDQDKRITRFSTRIGEAFQLELHDIGRSLKVVGPRLPFVDLGELVDQTLQTPQPQSVTGEYEGERLEVTAYRLDRTDDSIGQSCVVLLFQSETGK